VREGSAHAANAYSMSEVSLYLQRRSFAGGAHTLEAPAAAPSSATTLSLLPLPLLLLLPVLPPVASTASTRHARPTRLFTR